MESLLRAFEQYKAEWNKGDPNVDVLSRMMPSLRIQAVELNLADPKQTYTAREILEHAVLLSLRMNDTAAFERLMAQLRPFYYDLKNQIKVTSPRQSTLLGVHLLHLLVANRLADFHTELELLSAEDAESRYVQYAVQLSS